MENSHQPIAEQLNLNMVMSLISDGIFLRVDRDRFLAWHRLEEDDTSYYQLTLKSEQEGTTEPVFQKKLWYNWP